MRNALTYGTALLALVIATTAMPAEAMVRYVGKKRPLLVFAPNDAHPRFVQQRNIINGNRIGFSDRDIVVIYIAGSALSVDLGGAPAMNAAALRTRFRTSEGQFRALLIGKDGTVKLESSGALTAAELFGEIDRMPMRREEVKRRSGG